MKIALSAIIALTLGSIPVNLQAQDAAAQQRAGIYWLYVHMADALTTEYQVEVTDRNVLNGYRVSEIFPDNLLDSVRIMAETLCARKLNLDVACIYKMNKKGEPITSVGANNELEGMPSNTFKGALESADQDFYIRLDVMMNTGGKAIRIGPDKWSKIKPIVTASIKVLDRDKNVTFKNKVTLKDFSKLRAVERTRGTVIETRSETLGPGDIYMIYEQALHALLH